jgi:hypothetical protein
MQNKGILTTALIEKEVVMNFSILHWTIKKPAKPDNLQVFVRGSIELWLEGQYW